VEQAVHEVHRTERLAQEEPGIVRELIQYVWHVSHHRNYTTIRKQ